MNRNVTTVLTGLSYTEAPRWHDGRLWFSDFYTNTVRSAREDGTDLRVEADVPGQPSGLGWLPDGTLLVVSMRDRRLLRREADGTLVVHADLRDHADFHLNDMTVDSSGRAWVGTFGFDLMGGGTIRSTGLFRVDPDGTVTEAAHDLWFPNGIVIDGTKLLVDESLGNRVTAFDIGADGELTNRRVWAQFGPLPTSTDLAEAFGQVAAAPDGCTLDADGALWIADAVNARAIRVTESGGIVDQIQMQVGTFACVLGGADGKTLFVCQSPDFHEEACRAVRAASIAAVRVDVPATTP